MEVQIVATFGPACGSQSVLDELARAEVDLFRLNFSHGGYDMLGSAIASIRGAAETVGRRIPILQDLQGVRIRTSSRISRREVEAGGRVRLVPAERASSEEDVEVTRPELGRLVAEGDTILLGPGVRTADDVQRFRGALRELDVGTPLLAKAENGAAVSNARDIVDVADGLVFDRGNLGAELGYLGTQAAQMRVAELASALGKPLMMAPPVLESMIQSLRPTMFETAALYQSVKDGYSAVILAAETAVRESPAAAVR